MTGIFASSNWTYLRASRVRARADFENRSALRGIQRCDAQVKASRHPAQPFGPPLVESMPDTTQPELDSKAFFPQAGLEADDYGSLAAPHHFSTAVATFIRLEPPPVLNGN